MTKYQFGPFFKEQFFTLFSAIQNLLSLVTCGLETGVPVPPGELVAKYFSEKIKLNVSKAKVNLNGVYNGKYKLSVQNRNFMTESDFSELCAILIAD